MTTTSDAKDAARATKDTSEQAMQSRPMQWLGRAGFLGYGLIYLIIAWLTLQIARGSGGGEADKSGALQHVAEQSGGKLLLWAIAVGIAALGLRAFVDAAFGHPQLEGRKLAVKRVGSLVEGLVLLALAFSAAKAATGQQASRSRGSGTAESLMGSELGRALIGLVGVVIVAGSAYVIYRGITKRFVEDLDFARASVSERRWVTRLGQAGWTGVGAAYALLGLFVVIAALTHDANKAGGLDVALRETAAEPYGVALLVVVALGLALYGVFCWAEARFRDL